MMRDIKLIISDLDNTFTNDKYEYCPENEQAVHLAQSRGITVCACTARNWALAKGQVRRAGFSPYTVCSNGASIVDNKTGIPLHRHCIEPCALERLLHIGMRCGGYIAVYTNEQILYRSGHIQAHYTAYAQRWESVDRDLAIPVTPCESAVQMAILGAESAELVEISRADLSLLNEEDRTFLTGFSLSGIGGACVFVLAPGVNKLSGAKELSNLLNVAHEQVMAVGDNINDVEMLRWAGVGVAVANGDASAKAAADHITSDHNRAGFYHAVMDLALCGR